MARTIDWLYHRKSCTTCKKAHGFLDRAGVTVAEQADATKHKIDGEAALQLLNGLKTLIAVKGKKIERVDLGKPQDKENLLSLMIGPTGNLRAPTARVGKTMIVGFSEEAYSEIFSG
jgi:arsenate reductase-like glutaredoxin family protein